MEERNWLKCGVFSSYSQYKQYYSISHAACVWLGRRVQLCLQVCRYKLNTHVL